MGKPHGIIELLTKVGEEKVLIQPLTESIVNIHTQKRGGNRVSFLTDQISPGDLVRGNPEKIGIVVWIPREDIERVRAGWNEEDRAALEGGQP